MARLPYLEKSDLPPEHQDLLAREITLFKLMVNSPGAARAFQASPPPWAWSGPSRAA